MGGRAMVLNGIGPQGEMVDIMVSHKMTAVKNFYWKPDPVTLAHHVRCKRRSRSDWSHRTQPVKKVPCFQRAIAGVIGYRPGPRAAALNKHLPALGDVAHQGHRRSTWTQASSRQRLRWSCSCLLQAPGVGRKHHGEKLTLPALLINLQGNDQ